MFLFTAGWTNYVHTTYPDPRQSLGSTLNLQTVVAAAVAKPELVSRLALAEDQAKANEEQAKARRGPKFNLDGHVNGGLNAGLADNTPAFDRDRIGVIMNLDLYDGGKAIGAVHQAQSNLDLARLGSVQARFDAKARAIEFYVRALRAQEQAVSTASVMKSAEQNLSDVNSRYQSGSVPMGDVIAATSALAQVGLQAQSEERDRQAALADLEVLVGAVPEKASDVKQVLAPNLELNPEPQFEELFARAVKTDNQLQQLAVQKTLSRLNLQVAKAEFLPTFQANVGTGYVDYQNIQVQGGAAITTRQYLYLGLTGTVPLFTNRVRREAVRGGNDAIQQVAVQLEERKMRVRLSVALALSALKFAHEEFKAAQAQIADARERSRQAQMRFQNGLGNESDVLAALAGLANAEYALTGSKIDEMEARLQIRLLENPDWTPDDSR